MTDTEIIGFLRNNSYSRAIKGFYDIFPSIRQYVKANNGSSDDAKDIFQDALVILYKKIHDDTLVLSVPLKTYLYAVSKNCWMQELRRRKKLPLAQASEDIADIVTEEPGSVSAIAAFNLLGKKCRQLLILFYFHKKSFREIAAQLAFSDEKTAKNQKYRCLQKAKENYLTLIKTDSNGE